MNLTKILKQLNEILDQEHALHALKIEPLQEPHNYVPSPAIMLAGRQTLNEIKKYEKEHGVSCDYQHFDGKKCTLPVEEHVMHYGVVFLIKKGTTPGVIFEEIHKVLSILEKNKITHVAVVNDKERA